MPARRFTSLILTAATLTACAGVAPQRAVVEEPAWQDPMPGDPAPAWSDEEVVEVHDDEPIDEHHGVGHAILLWLPNRVFDVLDVVRARVRVGPGWTFSARATELFDINMGAHRTIFVGLRGPRGEPIIPWPLGLETFQGVELSVVDDTDAGGHRGPRYGPLEIGLGMQIFVIGVDVGVEPLELLDFVAGVFFFDPRNDDL